MCAKKFTLRKLVDYVKNPNNAVALKFVLFIFGSGSICVFPFAVLQMKHVGLTINEIAVIYLTIPVGSLLGPVVAGIIADKIGKYNLVATANFILVMISVNLFLIIPHVENPRINLSCADSSNCVFKIQNCISCMQTAANPISFTIKNCKLNDSLTNSSVSIFEDLPFTQAYNVSRNFKQECEFNMVANLDLNSSVNIPSAGVICEVKESSSCYEEIKPKYTITFIAFLIIYFLVNLFMSASFSICDAAVLALSKKYNLKVGKQKVMSILGFALAPLLSGVMNDYYTQLTGKVSYFPTFMIASVMFILGAIIMFFMKIEVPSNEGNMWKNSIQLFKHLDIVVFFLVLLPLGINYGFIESYIFIYLQSLGASGFLLGLTLAVGNLSSVPMLFFEDKVEKKLGRRNIYIICFVCYSIRMTGYSYIINPMTGLLFELLECFTYQLFWVTSMKLFPILAPKGLLATMTGMAGAIHWAIGKGIGGFIGGYIINVAGMRMAFRIMALVSLGGCVFYLIVNKLILGKSIERKEREIKEEEMATAKISEVSSLLKNNNQTQHTKVKIFGVNQSLLGISSQIGDNLQMFRNRTKNDVDET